MWGIQLDVREQLTTRPNSEEEDEDQIQLPIRTRTEVATTSQAGDRDPGGKLSPPDEDDPQNERNPILWTRPRRSTCSEDWTKN